MCRRSPILGDAAPHPAETVTVTVAVVEAVQELTVRAGTAGQFAPAGGATSAATLAALAGGVVGLAALFGVVTGTVAVA